MGRFTLRVISRMMLLAGVALILAGAIGALGVALAVSSPQSPLGETMERIAARLAAGWSPEGRDVLSSNLVYDYELGAEVPRLYMLSIPKIGLHAPVVATSPVTDVIDGRTIRSPGVPHAFAVGWTAESAPVGATGNTLFTGHNNIFGEVFKDLGDLEVGDPIIVETASGEKPYAVSQVLVLKEKGLPLRERIRNAAWSRPTDDERLTLITCWPYFTNSHRLVVVALPN